MVLRHILRLLVLASLASAAGCNVNPLPDPPNLDPGQITTPFDPMGARSDLDLFGGPGAAVVEDPARGTGVVWIANLERSDPPVVAPIAADGSFRAAVAGLPGDELRLQIRTVAGGYRPPLDLIANDTNAPLEVATRPLGECLLVDPATELDVGDVRVGDSVDVVLRVENDCGPLTLNVPRLRVGGGAFSVVGSDADSVTVRFAPTDVGEADDILFLEVTAPVRDRRPMTLRGAGV